MHANRKTNVPTYLHATLVFW